MSEIFLALAISRYDPCLLICSANALPIPDELPVTGVVSTGSFEACFLTY